MPISEQIFMDNFQEKSRMYRESVLSGVRDLSLVKLRELANYLIELSENNSILAPFLKKIARGSKNSLLKFIQMATGFILANEQSFVDGDKKIIGKIRELRE